MAFWQKPSKNPQHRHHEDPRRGSSHGSSQSQQSHQSHKGSMSSTSWEPLAQWYDGWVGKDGSLHHQKLAVPVALDLLKLESTDSLLDVGCGQGVMAGKLAGKISAYHGIDASPSLIRMAQQRTTQPNSRKLRFSVQDARSLKPSDLDRERFSSALFLLSIQDMDPVDRVLRSISQVLEDRSRIVIVMTHPCFRVPRQSGWGYDEGRKLVYRRVDSYLSPMTVPMKAFSGGKQGVSKSFHRPLQAYVEALSAQGFAITALKEVPTYKREESPGHLSKAKNRAYEEIPLFLAIRADRLS